MSQSATTFRVPESPEIIGMLVKALKIEHSALTDKNASRYYRGEHIREDNRFAIFQALGEVIVDNGLVPDMPFLEKHGMSLKAILTAAITGTRSDGMVLQDTCVAQ